eukprot:TRINITY_DN2677_c0_g1_i5.p1 TRINITY_DN2677_c0_g1~~TRINITY_DN2677_c0_g1_i5.p1  ORF type:complete len:991 (-),score=223.16 TRINITY_DN2677_c0_g1_i5:177-3149(-)
MCLTGKMICNISCSHYLEHSVGFHVPLKTYHKGPSRFQSRNFVSSLGLLITGSCTTEAYYTKKLFLQPFQVKAALHKRQAGKGIDTASDNTILAADKGICQIDEFEDVEKETLTSLEWPSVCRQISEFTSTSMGYMMANEGLIPIGTDVHHSRKLLDQTASALSLPVTIDFSDIQDIRAILDSAVSGDICTVRQLCLVKNTLHSAGRLSEQLCDIASDVSSDGRQTLEPLLQIFEGVDFLSDIKDDLGHCLDCNLFSIQDKASHSLKEIRANRKTNMRILQDLLKETATRIARNKAIDSPLVTKRRARMCVGIKATHKSFLNGALVLDISGSGATYFMEPKDAISLNNKEVQLHAAEQREEHAILRRLSNRISTKTVKIKELLERVALFDLACARAHHARWLNSVHPIFTQELDVDQGSFIGAGGKKEASDNAKRLSLENLHHPLLLGSSIRSHSLCVGANDIQSKLQRQVETPGGQPNIGKIEEKQRMFPVPIDINLGIGKKVVIISGPNTGGKTATLKTLGLAALMAKAGIFLPASGQPKIPWFDHIVADIGDDQSLEKGLSTYGAHIQKICNILKVATEQSLVLIDEIGSATDPAEGIALAKGILQHLANCVNLTVVTTHYSDLSLLKVKDSRFENAAMEFDYKTLQPTYRILWGSTGQSNALDVAQTIGFDNKVLNRAREWVVKLKPETQKEQQNKLFDSLRKQRDNMRSQISIVASILKETKQLHAELLAETDKIDERKEALRKKERTDMEAQIANVKEKIDKIVADFEKETQGDFKSVSIAKAQDAVASIVKAYSLSTSEANQEKEKFPIAVPQIGDKVLIKQLSPEPATVIEGPSTGGGRLLVQMGQINMRVKLNDIEKILSGKEEENCRRSLLRKRLKKTGLSAKRNSRLDSAKEEILKFGPAIQTSRNTLDLHGMRVVDALDKVEIALAFGEPFSVLFVVHGIGTGAMRAAVLDLLENHPRVFKFMQQSPTNYGCTVVYIR